MKLRPEEQLQIDIVKYLRLVAPQCEVFAIRNEGLRHPLGHKIAVAMGLEPGIHDLCILAPGPHGWLVHFMEIKTLKGVLSIDQDALHLRFTKRGIPHCTARSIEDARVALCHWKIETRETGT